VKEAILKILISVLILSAILANCVYAEYTRQDAFDYLCQSILYEKADSSEIKGSQNKLPGGTLVICGCDSFLVPSNMNYAWLFTVDVHFHAGWSHPLDLYFIDAENLQNNSQEDVIWPVGNVGMDRLIRNEIHGVDTPEQAFVAMQRVPYADPDPDLKAIIIAGSNPNGRDNAQEVVLYYGAARWYVTLKHLGFSDIRLFIGNVDPEEPEADHYIPFPDGHPQADYSDFMPRDLDGDGNDENIQRAIPSNIIEGFNDLGSDIDENDRVVVFINGHGSPSSADEDYHIKLYPEPGGDGRYTHWHPDDLKERIDTLSHCAELFIITDHCYNRGMYPHDLYGEMNNTHIISSSGNTQITCWDHIFTYQRYSYFTWFFTSYIIGYYPDVYDYWEDPESGENYAFSTRTYMQ